MNEWDSTRLRIDADQLPSGSNATRMVVSSIDAASSAPPVRSTRLGGEIATTRFGIDPRFVIALTALASAMVLLAFAGAVVVVVQSNSQALHKEEGHIVRLPDDAEQRLVAKADLDLVAPSVIGRSGRLFGSQWSGTAIPWRLDARGRLVLITNAHVALGGNDASGPELEVVFKGDVRRAALAIGIATEHNADLAMIAVDATGLIAGTHFQLLSPATTADWDELSPGDAVAAVGSPHGFPQTQVFGRISALRNGLERFDHGVRWIQIDGTVLPGNSGGPLLKAAGDEWQWIGVVTARGEVGIGLAIFAQEIAETRYDWIVGDAIEF